MDPLSLVRSRGPWSTSIPRRGRKAIAGAGSRPTCGAAASAWRNSPSADDRFNVLATIDPPRVVLSTHFDCVPPFFPSREDDGVLYGRGACDAKGILAAQIAALERLRAQGVRDVGALFLVGEERGSDGARVANAVPNACRFLINGEPTDSRLGRPREARLRVKLTAAGRAAHSCVPGDGGVGNREAARRAGAAAIDRAGPRASRSGAPTTRSD